MSPQAWFRLYGDSHQQGSFGSIMRGYRDGLLQADAMVDLYETEAISDEDAPPGATAPFAIGFGVPNRAHFMRRFGAHKWRGWVVAPNSTFVPEMIGTFVGNAEADLLAPSPWAASVLRRTFPEFKVHVLPHGVPALWRRLRPLEATPRPWRALHVTSTAGDRKCTTEVVAAFERLAALGSFGADPTLVVKADWLASNMLRSTGQVDERSRFVRVVDDFVERDWATFLRAFDAVVQPSRAEGFGLVPLEALAVGVPVVATACTGHAAYLDEETLTWAAAVVVEHGPDVPLLDDGEAAMAPEVRQDAIEAALLKAYAERDDLRQRADATRLEWVNRFGYDVICGMFVDFLRGQ